MKIKGKGKEKGMPKNKNKHKWKKNKKTKRYRLTQQSCNYCYASKLLVNVLLPNCRVDSL